MHFQRSSILSLAFVAIGLVALPARAQLVAYDGFEGYEAGLALNGNNGGIGWEGENIPVSSWESVSGATVTDFSSSPLSYSGGDISINGGDRAVLIGSDGNSYFERQFADSDTPVGGSEIFFSFLFQRTSGETNDFMNFWLSNDGDRNNSGGMGMPSNNPSSPEFGVRIRSTSDNSSFSTTTPQNGETYFLVGRFSRDGNSGNSTDPLRFDLMELWINPTTTDFSLLGTPDAVEDASSGMNGGFTHFGLRTVDINNGTEEYYIDELHIGTNYLSVVVPVPEPTSGALVLGAAALLAFRRRRQA